MVGAYAAFKVWLLDMFELIATGREAQRAHDHRLLRALETLSAASATMPPFDVSTLGGRITFDVFGKILDTSIQ